MNINNILHYLSNHVIKFWHLVVKGIIKREFQQNIGKVEIYKEWDSFPSPTPILGKNTFYQENNEVNKLAHWIRETNGGSVLIGGVRGVGKTAFAYYAIHKAHKITILDKLYFWVRDLIDKVPLKGFIFTGIGKFFENIFLLIFNLIVEVNPIVFIPVNL